MRHFNYPKTGTPRSAPPVSTLRPLALLLASALLTACYQDYARLFNSVVDVYQLACDRCRAPAADGSLHTYSADIGLWERGVTVELQAISVEQALALAGVAVAEARHDGRISDDDEQMVVQVHLLPGQSDAKPRLVYDFINGIYQ